MKFLEYLGGRKFIGFLLIIGALVLNSMFKLDLGVYFLGAYGIYVGGNSITKIAYKGVDVSAEDK